MQLLALELVSSVCKNVIKHGIKNILLEKPGALDYNQIVDLNNVQKNLNLKYLLHIINFIAKWIIKKTN